MTLHQETLITGEPWAIAPEILSQLGKPGYDAPIALRPTAAGSSARFGNRAGVVSIIPVMGVITNRESLRQQLFGVGTSVQKLTSQFRAALSDPSVLAIVFDVDSPGGEVSGTLELADEIFRSRARKRTIAVANCQALSGAFWIASAASELVVTPSGVVGSIGVFALHEDYSKALEQEGVKVTFISAGKYKTDGNDAEPLSESARTDLQGKVDSFHDRFISDVARGRGVQKSTVRERFGQGRAVLARDAVVRGMADRVATFDQTMSRLISGPGEDKQQPRSFAPFRLALLRRRLELL